LVNLTIIVCRVVIVSVADPDLFGRIPFRIQIRGF
jgi:hypothetical protein